MPIRRVPQFSQTKRGEAAALGSIARTLAPLKKVIVYAPRLVLKVTDPVGAPVLIVAVM